MKVMLSSAMYETSALIYDVKHILRYPEDHEWSTQGFGMLRTYLDKDRKHRMNVWHSALEKPSVSTIHDHPWHFTSLIVAGTICNQRYKECDPQLACPGWLVPCSYATIKCGPGGGMVNCQGDIDLELQPAELYGPRDSYHQYANEIHETHAWDGTVSIITRTFRPDTEHARVFWLRGMQWVDAEPRVATEFEIKTATLAALRRLEVNE